MILFISLSFWLKQTLLCLSSLSCFAELLDKHCDVSVLLTSQKNTESKRPKNDSKVTLVDRPQSDLKIASNSTWDPIFESCLSEF